MGGGGAMFAPSISPHHPELLFVASDMSGLFRSANGGGRWEVVDGRRMTANVFCPVVFDPRSGRTDLYAYADYRFLRRSRDSGHTWSPVALPASGVSYVTAMAMDDQGRLLVGTSSGQVAVGTPSAADPDVFDWSAVQPLPGGGRVTAFVVVTDPASGAPVGYVATAGATGSVFRCTDLAQSSWTDIGTPQTKSIVDLAGAMGAAGVVLYASTGSSVQRFDGAAWTALTLPFTNADPKYKGHECHQPRYEQLAVGVAATTVYVSVCAAREAPPANVRLFKSVDSGQTWQHVLNLDAAPVAPVGARNVQLGWVEADLGLGWGGRALGLAAAPAASGTTESLAFTNLGVVYLSDDGGASWRQAYSQQSGTVAPGQPWSSRGLEVTTSWHYDQHPADPQRHYISATDIGLMQSTDGGATWKQTTPAARRGTASPRRFNTVYELAFDPTSAHPGRVWAACSDQHDIPYDSELGLRSVGDSWRTGGVAMSDDFGVTWSDRSGGLPNWKNNQPPPVTSIVLDRATSTLWAGVYGSDDGPVGGVFSSVDDGVTWTDRSLNLPTANRNVYRLQPHPGGGVLCLITARRERDPGDPRKLLSFKEPSSLWLLEPTGAGPFGAQPAWRELTASLQPWWATDFAVHPTAPDTIYLCTAFVTDRPEGTNQPGKKIPGAVFKTTDGGANWKSVLEVSSGGTGALPADGDHRDFLHAFSVAFDPEDPKAIFVSTRTHGLWHSADEGSTWSALKVVPFMSLHRFTFSPPGDPKSWAPWLHVTSFGGGVWRIERRERTFTEWNKDIFGGCLPCGSVVAAAAAAGAVGVARATRTARRRRGGRLS
jgi:photosystem II stability/assembly factor-like uncharacterized protein